MEFLTLDEYLVDAKKILNIYGYPCHKNDDDAISFVAYYMMKADNTWDGTSSAKTTWRFNQARYAILKLKTKHRKQRKTTSLHKVISEKSGRKIHLHEVIADKSENEHKDSIDEIISAMNEKLTKKQQDCISMYYIDGFKMEEIGQKLGITKQAVSLNIKNGIKKIKNECKS